jgi:hypothetical protein
MRPVRSPAADQAMWRILRSVRCLWNADRNPEPLNVRLDRLDPEQQLVRQVVQELDCGLLVQLVVDPQHPDLGGVVDRGDRALRDRATGRPHTAGVLAVTGDLTGASKIF